MRNTQYNTDVSIYRLGLPFLPNRIDLAAIESEEQALLPWLAFGSGARVLRPDGNHKLLHRLLHLYTESRNLEKQLGPNLLGLGWPLISVLREEGMSVMPMLFWRVVLSPGLNRSNEWILKHALHRNPSLNPEFARFLKETGQEESLEKLQTWLREPIEKEAHLLRILHLFDPEALPPLSVHPCPELNDLPTVPTLHAAGVLGIFPLYPTLRWNQEDLAFALQQQSSPPLPHAHRFGVSVLNPAQSGVVESVHQHQTTLVLGPDHSGKTTSLTHLLSNFLSNGLRCLVVSDRMGALTQAQKSLHTAGIQDSDLLLRDPNIDKGLMLELLRVRAASLNPETAQVPERFKYLLDKCRREQQLLQQGYQSCRKPTFGKLNRTELVGKFLNCQALAGRELLGSHLNMEELPTDKDTFDELRAQIQTAETLFEEVQTLAHPLRKLHPRLFEDMDALRALPYLEQELARHRLGFEQVQHQLIQGIDQYALSLQHHYQAHTDELQQKIRHLRAGLVDYYNRHNDYARSGSGSLWIRGVFSEKAREAEKDQQQVVSAYKDLHQAVQGSKYVEFQLKSSPDFAHPERMEEQLQALEQQLDQWSQQVPGLIQEELGRLSSRNQHPAAVTIDAERISKLELLVDERTDALNEALLFETPFQHQMLTLPKRLNFVEQTLEQLELIQLNLRDFSTFFPWQQHWIALSPEARKIVQALVRVKPGNWQAAFDSWYLHRCLQKLPPELMPESAAALESLGVHIDELKPLLPAQIAQLWTKQQTETLRDLRRSNKNLYEKLFGKHNQRLAASHNFRELLEEGIEPITSFFPVLCCTSSMAMQMLPAKKEFFDLIVILETNCVSPEKAAALRLLGKRLCVFANPELGSVPNQTSATLEALDAYTINLPRYGKAPASAMLQVEALEGRFLEQEGINEAEARHLIGLLNHIEATPQRTFPSVALIAFTIEQRDLLASYLLRLKQQGGASGERVQQLERNGLGVFCIDELYGQEFDVWLVSMCFGAIDLQGTLSKKMNVFLSPAGRKALYLLEKNAATKTTVVHSLPAEWVERAAEANPLAGLLQRLGKQTAREEDQPQTALESSSYFANRLVKELRKQLPSKAQVEIAFAEPGRSAGVWVELPEQAPVLLQPDLFFSNAPFTSFSWEYQERNTLRGNGVTVLPIWTAQWWQQPDRQTQTLAQSLTGSNPPE